MRAFLAVAAITVCVPAIAAPPREFPYEAVIDRDNVDVYCGPGRKYYATSSLNRGDRVTVIRHDPGGWCMILPPPGSFSWIAADAVERQGHDRGIVRDNNVVVRIGSQFESNPEYFYESVALSRGAEVEILGMADMDFGRGPRPYLKIKPPENEFRWVPGQFVVPADQIASRRSGRFDRPAPAPEPEGGPEFPPDGGQAYTRYDREHDHDHYHHDHDHDGHADNRGHRDRDEYVERPLVRISRKEAVRKTGPSAEELDADRSRLKELDDRFRRMIDRDPTEWNLAELEEGYNRLKHQSASPAFDSQIRQRLAAVERYRRVKHEYEDFIRLSLETDRRDAELLSMQNGGVPPVGPAGSTLVMPGPRPYGPHYPATPTHPVGMPRPLYGPAWQSGGYRGTVPPQMGPASYRQPYGPTSYAPPMRPGAFQAPLGPQFHQMPSQPYAPAMNPYPPGMSYYPPGMSYEPSLGPLSHRRGTGQGNAALAASVPHTPNPVHGPALPPRHPNPRRASGFVTQAGYETPAAGAVPPARAPLPPTRTVQAPVPRGYAPAMPRGAGGAPFSGAGIVQRAAVKSPGAPQHVLVAPGGKILAYLEPAPGINLDSVVGRQMGVRGPRQFRPDLRMDHIVVQNMTPVHITR